ncbi:MAG: ABC transporter permease [Clostridia bacterium]|nr:ABC transporter permease [Clostridia bacterium]
MKAILYAIYLQWKMDLRNKGVLITYYLVPLLFFVFIGNIFTSINPLVDETIIQTMVIFAISMGAILGSPIPLVDFFSSEIKKSYMVSKIPLWHMLIINAVSAFIHLLIVSIIIVCLSPVLLGAFFPKNILVLMIYVIVFIIANISIGTALGLVVKSTTKLTMISQILFLPSIMLSGIMFPVSLLPDFLQKAGAVFPASWGFKYLQTNNFDFLIFLPFAATLMVTSLIIFISYKRVLRL